MADESSKPNTTGRREHILRFIPKGRQQDDARRIFEMLDKSASPPPDSDKK